MSQSSVIVQIGKENWAERYQIPENLEWVYWSDKDWPIFLAQQQESRKSNAYLEQLMEEAKAQGLDVAPVLNDLEEQKQAALNIRFLLITDELEGTDYSGLADLVEAYEIFYPAQLVFESEVFQSFLQQRMAQSFTEEPVDFLTTLAQISFTKPYGAKLAIRDFLISSQLTLSSLSYQGNAYLRLTADFGQDFCFLGNFSYNISCEEKMALDLWPEFLSEGTCQFLMKVTLIGLDGSLLQEWSFQGTDLTKQCRIRTQERGYLAISYWGKGQGQLAMGPLHYRFSRLDYGELILGGRRYADANRQECHYYFNPGDWQPPLMVYFAGWRTAEGFEGFPMMKKLGAPFLLFADPRLEGGAFYMGSQAYETRIIQIVEETLAQLGFDQRELVLSGLSMGTFAALYYTANLKPHALILGKPLTNLGTIAQREELERPAGFPTSLDLLAYFAGSLSEEAVHALNHRFWQKLEEADLTDTKFYVTYMTDDDYDQEAFDKLLQLTQKQGAKLVAKAWLGRHNDRSYDVATWFQSQYAKLLACDFNRKNG